MGIEFLVRGILDFDEPGVLMAFEETANELAANVTSLGFDLKDLQARKMLRLDHVHVDRSEIEETGEYDLDGLVIRLGYAIDSFAAHPQRPGAPPRHHSQAGEGVRPLRRRHRPHH